MQDMINQIISRFHLPPKTVVEDEDENMILLKSFNGKDSTCEINLITVWKFYKKSGDIQEVVTSHPTSNLTCQVPTGSQGVSVSLDSIFAINSARQFPLADSLVLVEGDPFGTGNVKSYIIDMDNRKAILLPSNYGCIGFTSEEGFPICRSYRSRNYISPRYSVVSVYDMNGKLVKEMSLKRHGK